MLHPIIIQSMNEEKKKKPLLPYEQVVKMIDEHISQEEDVKVDERIVQVEKAAEELEAQYKEERLGIKKEKRRCWFKRFWRRLFRRCRT